MITFTSDEHNLLFVVVQSKQASDGLRRSPLSGAQDPLDTIDEILKRLNGDARLVGEVVVGRRRPEHVPIHVAESARSLVERLTAA